MKTMIENLPGVLIVESDTALRQLLRSSLSAKAYRLQEAVSDAETLTWMATSPKDAVILSMQLPDRDGVDFIRQLRL